VSYFSIEINQVEASSRVEYNFTKTLFHSKIMQKKKIK
jgi:hypothetical protein